ncbi:putative Xaa-Pro aminopeptidase P [Nymphaea thermarum]|nr:putative Xaa-Pro aminopeptidase P [Nymphaea thermarum]
MEATLRPLCSRFLLPLPPPATRTISSILSPVRLPFLRWRMPTFVRCSSSPAPPEKAVARPSSELRRKAKGLTPDERLVALRKQFTRPDVAIDAYIIPSEDAHQSEFIAECFMRRAYISGFTGSAGTAVVTKDKAALWTDGRYFLQAENQLGPDWSLMRMGNPGVPTTAEWLNEILMPGCRIGIDPFLFSSDSAEELREVLLKKNLELIFIYNFNLVDEIWDELRPSPPIEPMRVHSIKYAGLDISSKMCSLRSRLAEARADAIVISKLDEVAWLLNLRGQDVPHSPVTYSYLLVENNSATLLVDNSKITEEVMVYLRNAGVTLKPYEAILTEVERLAEKGTRLWLDKSSVNAAVVDAFLSACNRYFEAYQNKQKKKSTNKASKNKGTTEASELLIDGPAAVYGASPISLEKAVKNNAELEGMRQAHLR